MKLNIFYILLLFLIVSCNGKKAENMEPIAGDTPNSGRISIAVDESFLPLLNDEVSVFEKETPNSKIELVKFPEAKGIQEFLDKNFRAVITTRKLTDDEISYGKKKDLNPLHFFIAFDAVVLIVNKKNPDSVYNKAGIQKLFQGESKNENSVVFNSNGSGEIQYFKNLYNLKSLPSNFFATNNLSELTNYISIHESAIGVISFNSLLNNSDSILQKARVVSIKNNDFKNYSPDETNIRSGYYPFRREVYIVCGESWPGLGTGFAKFMTTDIGQTIIKRAGLIPARLPLRMIEVKNDF